MSERVDAVADVEGEPSIVHLSDVHGYYEDGRSALLAVGETDAFDPVVAVGDDDELEWAGNDYVLVVNGDLIDRGPANEACFDLVWRLQRQAPPGRVRYHLGNHEMGILLPELVRWPTAFSTNLDRDRRREFVERVRDGRVTVAFDGHEYQYSHAGRNDPPDAAAVNDQLRDAAGELLDAMDDGRDAAVQREFPDRHERIFGIGSRGGRGPDAGMLWMDFEHLSPSAPPQVVGHTMHARPDRKGNVVCGNVVRRNQGTPGGEGVVIEEPDGGLTAVLRRSDGGVETTDV